MSKTASSKPTPAYVAFKTLTAFIETLHKTAVPPSIHRELMPRMSGIVQSQLLSSMRFLGLIDNQNNVQDPLRDLVKSFGTDRWESTWAEIVNRAYAPITGKLDLGSETGAALRTAFRTHGGAEGDTNVKAVRFYVRALEEAGIQFSPHFKTRRVNATARKPAKKRRRIPPANRGTGDADTSHRPDYSGMESFPIGPGRAIMVPSDLTLAECAVIEKLGPLLQAYATGVAEGGA